MAMDIELRNQLGALTAQVQELTKHSKNLDGTLAGALDKGAKSAGGLAAGTRAARTEMTLAEQVSTRIGRAWATQMFSLATGAVGVTALWQTVTSQINAAMERAEKRAKSVRDFADKSRPAAPPTILPELRKAIRGTAPALAPDDQAEALKSYLTAGGSANENEVSRLGQVANASGLLGFDSKELSSQYAKLRKLGVKNPEDVIMAMTKQGKAGDIDKMKGGQAQAMGAKNQGDWNSAIADSRRMTPEDFAAWSTKTKAAIIEQKNLKEGEESLHWDARKAEVHSILGIPEEGSPFEYVNPSTLIDSFPVRMKFPGKSREEIIKDLDKRIRSKGMRVPDELADALPRAVSVLESPPGTVETLPAFGLPAVAPQTPREVLPPTTDPDELWRRAMAESARAGGQGWAKGVRQMQSPAAPSQQTKIIVHIGSDMRPVPVNAGD